jgi:hypothetical protein
VAERTGIAAGTIRMWEQRYGFPEPQRLPSGYRRYTPEDVETLRRVQAYRRRGLSIRAAIDRALEEGVNWIDTLISRLIAAGAALLGRSRAVARVSGEAAVATGSPRRLAACAPKPSVPGTPVAESG